MENQLSTSIIDSITSDTIKEISSEFLEVGLDQFLDNEALKAFPVFGTALKITKGVFSIRENFFAKKIYKFLFQLKDVSDKNRTKFLNKVTDDPKYKKDIGEKLVIILDRLDEMNKAAILGNLFKAFIENRYEQTVFYRLSNIIDKVFMYDLNEFVKFYQNHPYWHYNVEILGSFNVINLVNAGFLNLKIKEVEGKRELINGKIATGLPSNDLTYKLNVYGELILKYGMLLKVSAIEKGNRKVPKF